MRNKSVVNEAREIQIAVELINLGARLQLLQEETHLSRERLLKLYKEVKGESPSKGMLPYSTDWFMSWSANIHSSLFMGIHQFMLKHTGLSGVEALIKSYRLYLEQAEVRPRHGVAKPSGAGVAASHLLPQSADFVGNGSEVQAAKAFAAQGEPGKYRADLYLLAQQRLHALGVSRIFGGEYCTFGERERFFSYRRDGVSGRMGTFIWLA